MQQRPLNPTLHVQHWGTTGWLTTPPWQRSVHLVLEHFTVIGTTGEWGPGNWFLVILHLVTGKNC